MEEELHQTDFVFNDYYGSKYYLKIGNSKGLILSKSILEQYNIHDKVEVILE